MYLQEKISNILNTTKAYSHLGELIRSLGLSDSDLADMACDIEGAIERIINEKIEDNE
jgi:hypothetical protein